MPLEVLRISTVVDFERVYLAVPPLEVLRISTVVDDMIIDTWSESFGSAKNFYCCRLPLF